MKKTKLTDIFIKIVGVLLVLLIVFASYNFGLSRDKNTNTKVSSNKLIEIYDLLSNDWLNTGEEVDLEETLAKAMIESVGDRYNGYFTQSDLNEYTNSINLNYEGIGVSYTKASGQVIITKVFVGSKAEEAGLLTGDIILEANGVVLENIESTEVAALIKGESGTSVLLKISRGNNQFEVNVVRAAVDNSALYEIKSANNKQYGLLTISSFGSSTAAEVEKALAYFKANNIDTITIDLRDNPGGYLQAAKGILDLFFEKGQIELATEDKEGNKVTYKSDNENPYRFVYGYVLVNENSASASEVLAGALQEVLDYTVIGKTTYGKGLAQDQKTLSDLTVVKYTYARWLLPSGTNIDGVGIKPNIEVDNIDTSGLYSFELENTLSFDMVSTQVGLMQKMLNILNYDCGRSDGYFSEQTKQALTQFQNDKGLTSTGSLDEESKNRLIEEIVKMINLPENDNQFLTMEQQIK